MLNKCIKVLVILVLVVLFLQYLSELIAYWYGLSEAQEYYEFLKIKMQEELTER